MFLLTTWLTRPRVLITGEQVLISGSNFILIVMAGRALARDEFGVFSFAMAAFAFALGFYKAGVTLAIPGIALDRSGVDRTARLWMVLHVGIITLVAVGLGAVWAVAECFESSAWIAAAMVPCGSICAANFCYELARRLLIQCEDYRRLLGLGVLYAVVVIGSATTFVHAARTAWSPTLVLVAAATAPSLPVLALLYLRADPIGSHLRAVPVGFLRFWKEVRSFWLWASLSHVVYSGYGFFVQTLLATLHGAGEMALFAATRTLIQPMQVFAVASESLDRPAMSRILRVEGIDSVRLYVARRASRLSAVAAAYAAVIVPLAGWSLNRVYRGQYHDGAQAVCGWAIVTLVMLWSYPADIALYAVRPPRIQFSVRGAAALVGATSALGLIPFTRTLGALGAMGLAWLATGIRARSALKSLSEYSGAVRGGERT